MNIGYMSTYDVPCGIAKYTEDVINNLPKGYDNNISIYDEGKFWSRNSGDYSHISSLVKEDKLDVLHIQHSPTFFPHKSFIDFCNSLDIPLLITLHDTDDSIAEFMSPIKAKFIVPLGICKRILSNHIDVDNIEVIEHGAYEFSPTDMNEAKTKLGIDTKTKVISQFGFYGVDKDMKVSLQAYNLVREDSVFIFLGSLHPLAIPTHKDYLKQTMILAVNLKLQDRVMFTYKFLSEESLNLYLSASDVLLFNHRHIFPAYSASASIKRTLFAGKPLVVSSSPLYSEFTDKEVMKFEMGDHKRISWYINEVLSNKDLYSKYSNNILEYGKKCSWTYQGMRHFKLYQEVMEKKK